MIVMPRRRFLIGPAIIAASSLMPGHSIAHLLVPKLREFDFMVEDPISRALCTRESPLEDRFFWGVKEDADGIVRERPVRMTADEVRYHYRMKAEEWASKLWRCL